MGLESHSTPCQVPFDPPKTPEPFSFVALVRRIRTLLYGKRYFVRSFFAPHGCPTQAKMPALHRSARRLSQAAQILLRLAHIPSDLFSKCLNRWELDLAAETLEEVNLHFGFGRKFNGMEV